MIAGLPGPRRAPNVRTGLRAFVGIAVVVLVVIALATVVIAQLVAQQEALRDAERTTARLGSLVVAPILGGMMAGDAGAFSELDRAIDLRLADGTIMEVNVWRADGTVLFSDDEDIMGRRFRIPPEALLAIDRHEVSAAIAVADETGDLPPGERFVEVYVPLTVPGGPPLAFEAYYSIQRVDERAAALATELILLALVPLVILQLVQIPIAVSLTRRVSRQETERTALLERALSASERERRTIAAGLHDGVVQDLAGVGYALGALVAVVPQDRRKIAETCASSVRDAVGVLRRLMIDIYPPDLSGSGLAAAVGDLAQPLRDRGVEVTVEVTELPAMASDVAAAVYRVARETLANVAKHAGASAVRIELGPADGLDGARAVRLSVTDDGSGLAADALDRRQDGHFGIQMLIDRAADLGGRFAVSAAPGGGVAAVAVIPTRPSA